MNASEECVFSSLLPYVFERKLAVALYTFHCLVRKELLNLKPPEHHAAHKRVMGMHQLKVTRGKDNVHLRRMCVDVSTSMID